MLIISYDIYIYIYIYMYIYVYMYNQLWIFGGTCQWFFGSILQRIFTCSAAV